MTLQAIIEKLQELRSRQRTRATRTWVRKHLARLPAHLGDDLGVQTWELWGDASSHPQLRRATGSRRPLDLSG
jgi:hypothetical protein